MELLKPHRLKPGDLLGIVACSTPINACAPDARERAYERLHSMGFILREAWNCQTIHGHSAGTIQERVDVLHEFFSDPKIKGIINFWGGFQSHQLLEYLDYDLIRKNPKPFIGFSDTTALQIALYQHSGLVTFSGPSVITFAKPDLPEFTLSHFKKVLMTQSKPVHLDTSKTYSDNPWYLEENKLMRYQENPGLTIYRHGKASGTAIGGNLGTMLLLAGTRYWPDLNGKILFVEDDDAESPETIDRMCTQLRQIGVYEQISGLVVGRYPSSVKFCEGNSFEMILDEALKGYDFPVITGADFGHTDPLFTIPIGVSCTIDTKDCSIVFSETGTLD